jgi:hypothetical protein
MRCLLFCAADIILMENIVSVFRSGSDVTMYVVGSSQEVRSLIIYERGVGGGAEMKMVVARFERMRLSC